MAGSFSPQTIPSLTGWQAAAGTWERQPDTQLVGATTGHTGAQILAAETGLELASAVARPQDIELRLDSAWTELGKEGYELQIGVGGVQLTAATEAGLFYATRTLSQLLRQGPALPYGRAVDRPCYEERGVTLCAGQVGIQMDWVERLLTEMADLKLNHLLLELKLKPAKHPESAAWHYYTRAQIRQLCHLARERHIDLIPEINSPGHLGIWLEQHPELQLVDRHGQGHPEMLDISKPQAVHYYLELVDEYLEAFDSPWFHMGADEYLIGTRASEFPALTAWAQATYGAQATIDDAFTAFINTVADHVRAAGKRLRIWNDGVIDTQVVRLDPSVVVEFWYGQGISAAALAQRGTRILNATELLYWSRSAEFYRVDCRALWESGWQVGQLPGTALKPEPPALLGAKLSIWPDLAYLRTEGEVEQQVCDSLRLVSQLTWAGGHDGLDWEGFKARIDAVDRSPLWKQPPGPGAGLYRISDASGQVLSTTNSADNDGVQLVLLALDAAQEDDTWRLLPTPEGYYQLVSTRSGLALSLDEGRKHLGVVTQVGAAPSLRPGADMQQGPDALGARLSAEHRNPQKWRLLQQAEGTVLLRHALSGLDLAIATGLEQHVDLEQSLQVGALVVLPTDLHQSNWVLQECPASPVLQCRGNGLLGTAQRPLDLALEVTNPSSESLEGVALDWEALEAWQIEALTELPTTLPAGGSACARLRALPVQASGSAALPLRLRWHNGALKVVAELWGAGGELMTPEPVAASSQAGKALAGGAAADGSLAAAFDADTSTAWRTAGTGATNPYPHWVTMRLPVPAQVTALEYTPAAAVETSQQADPDAIGHADGAGWLGLYEISTSEDGQAWSEPVASGLAQMTDQPQTFLVGASCRYLRLRGLSSSTGGGTMSAARIQLRLLPAGPSAAPSANICSQAATPHRELP